MLTTSKDHQHYNQPLTRKRTVNEGPVNVVKVANVGGPSGLKVNVLFYWLLAQYLLGIFLLQVYLSYSSLL